MDKIKKILNGVLSAVYPEKVTCDGCGAELVADTRYRLCSRCVSEMPFNDKKVCLLCGSPIGDEADYCLRCQRKEFKFKLCRAPFVYDGKARQMIYALKFGQKRYLADFFAVAMTDCYLENNFDCDLVTFVPMTKAEVKKRGFNQAELMAKGVAERLKLTIEPALIKLRDTSAQKELSGAERAKNLVGAFHAVEEMVKGKTVLLVDDVFTTGATANECAIVLLKAKAKAVLVLSAAITQYKVPSEKVEAEKENEKAVAKGKQGKVKQVKAKLKRNEAAAKVEA